MSLGGSGVRKQSVPTDEGAAAATTVVLKPTKHRHYHRTLLLPDDIHTDHQSGALRRAARRHFPEGDWPHWSVAYGCGTRGKPTSSRIVVVVVVLVRSKALLLLLSTVWGGPSARSARRGSVANPCQNNGPTQTPVQCPRDGGR